MVRNIKDFKRQKELLVCIDSDGCVFNTMDIKWKECFIPELIKIFNLQIISNEVRQIMEHINLYSMNRGINRFESIPVLFDELKNNKILKLYNFKLPDITDLINWLEKEESPSEITLKKEIEHNNSRILKIALQWSQSVNKSIEMTVKNIPPYPYVEDNLKDLQTKCDIAVVSSTNYTSLEKEWSSNNLDKYINIICSQEVGSKSYCISRFKKLGYSNILMIGDAIGDLSAAKENDIMFYPIIPKREIESWKSFRDSIKNLFLSGNYDFKIEKEYTDLFYKNLK